MPCSGCERSGSAPRGRVASPWRRLEFRDDGVVVGVRQVTRAVRYARGVALSCTGTPAIQVGPNSGSSSSVTAPISRACSVSIHSSTVRHQPMAAPALLPSASHSAAVLRQEELAQLGVQALVQRSRRAA